VSWWPTFLQPVRITEPFPQPTHFNPEDGSSSKALMSAYRATQYHNPEDHNLNNQQHENLNAYTIHVCALCSPWGKCLAGWYQWAAATLPTFLLMNVGKPLFP
jgi:hypothetical protein